MCDTIRENELKYQIRKISKDFKILKHPREAIKSFQVFKDSSERYLSKAIKNGSTQGVSQSRKCVNSFT